MWFIFSVMEGIVKWPSSGRWFCFHSLFTHRAPCSLTQTTTSHRINYAGEEGGILREFCTNFVFP